MLETQPHMMDLINHENGQMYNNTAAIDVKLANAENRNSMSTGSNYHDEVPLEEEDDDIEYRDEEASDLDPNHQPNLYIMEHSTDLKPASGMGESAEEVVMRAQRSVDESTTLNSGKEAQLESRFSQATSVSIPTEVDNAADEQMLMMDEEVPVAQEVSSVSTTAAVGAPHDNTPPPTFEQIRSDLEKKNVSGSLQPYQPGSVKLTSSEEQSVDYHQEEELQQQHPPVLVQQTQQAVDHPAVEQAIHQTSAQQNPPQPQAMENGVSNGQPMASQSNGMTNGSSTNGSGAMLRSGGKTNGSQGGSGREDGPSGAAKVRLTYDMGSCAMHNLVVYTDKAHVYRKEQPKFNSNEVTEVLFENVSPAIDKDSIRVELRGRATILDVTFNERPVDDAETSWTHASAQLADELRQSRRDVEAVLHKISRAERQRSVLDSYAQRMNAKTVGDEDGDTGEGESFNSLLQEQQMSEKEKSSSKHKKSSSKNAQAASLTTLTASSAMGDKELHFHMPPSMHSPQQPQQALNPYDPKTMETLTRFLSTYEEQADKLDSAILDGEEHLERLHERIDYLERQLHDLDLKHNDDKHRELSVIVEPRENGQVEMIISYVVNRCTWKPSYDIRMFNTDGSMKIIYYGMVYQSTGEDWANIPKMSLSTAQPGLGGTVPELGLQTVHYRQSCGQAAQPSTVKGKKANAAGSSTAMSPPRSGGMSLTMPSASQASGLHRARQPISTHHPLRKGGSRIIPHTPCDTMDDLECHMLSPRTGRYADSSRHHSSKSDWLGSKPPLKRLVRPRSYIASLREQGTPTSTVQRASSALDHAGRQTYSRAAQRRALGASLLLNTAPNGLGPVPASLQSLAQQEQREKEKQANQPSVQFDVPRPLTLIRCDAEPHRATVGLIDLQPHYDYVSVPKRSPHAFLKATAVNQSSFHLLAGQTNIYADNTFIGKIDMKCTAPGEQLTCQLGAEHGIKLSYRPMFKYREGGGSSSKCNMTFKQVIEVKNTFDRSVKLTVIDQVPVSGEDKIKVSLLEPTIKHPEKYDPKKPIRMNKLNNVEWDVELQPGELRELTLKFSVEHPASEELEVTVAS